MINASGYAESNLIQKLNTHPLPSPAKVSLPTSRQRRETIYLEFSITPVQVLNQSPQQIFSAYFVLAFNQNRCRALANFLEHQNNGIVNVYPNAENHELDRLGAAVRLGQNAR